jgi:hypothetical protein
VSSPLDTRNPIRGIGLVLMAALALSACKRESTPPPTAAEPQLPAVAPEDAPVAPPELKDVIESTDRYVVGISYPATVNRHPGLARTLAAYTDAQRAELMEAVEAFGNDKPSAPYELSLAFEQVVDTPMASRSSRASSGCRSRTPA